MGEGDTTLLRSKKYVPKSVDSAKGTTQSPQASTVTPEPQITPPVVATPTPPLAEPSCVECRADGTLCGKPIHSPKYQLCATHYASASRNKTLTSYKVYRIRKKAPSTGRIRKHRVSDVPAIPEYADVPDAPIVTEPVVDDMGVSSTPLKYGTFSSEGYDKWEIGFLRTRRTELAHLFDDPSKKGLAHRMILAELECERLGRRATFYSQNRKTLVLAEKTLTLKDRVEKTVRELQKELLFLPSQTQEEKKIEEVFTEMARKFQEYKAKYAVGFDADEVALMSKKGMNVEFEKARLAEITGRLSKERAKDLARVILVTVFDGMREMFTITDVQMEDIIEKLLQKLRDTVPTMAPLID